MTNEPKEDRDVVFLKLFLKSTTEVTDEEVAYFREHPDLIEEVTAPVGIHIIFLWVGAIAGAVLVGVSKILNYSGLLAAWSEGAREFVVDIVFEIGVALIGAAVTAYLLGVLLNKQQENAAKWRAEIRRKVEEQESLETPVIEPDTNE